MTQKIPFNPLPEKVLLAIAKRFRGTGATILHMFPGIETDLRHGEIDIEKETYAAAMFILPVFYFFFIGILAYIFATRLAPQYLYTAPLGLGALFAALIFIQLLFYPKIIVKKKVRGLERNLVFALRTILVEIKSGVTLFDAINIVAQGDNGEVSREFKKTVEKIETGYFQEQAIEEMGENNPSLYFKRAIWQLVNGLKAGSDI
ncbi:MAG: type II secretion system F family protein, partial [archaeon]|nr:type II secretion system F family protein [archaeon]